MMITRLYQSERDPARDPYVTNVDDSGSASCSCPGWIFSKLDPRKDCKHIRWLRTELSSTAQKGSGTTKR